MGFDIICLFEGYFLMTVKAMSKLNLTSDVVNQVVAFSNAVLDPQNDKFLKQTSYKRFRILSQNKLEANPSNMTQIDQLSR